MTNLQSMKITNRNDASGSYDNIGTSSIEDRLLIGDATDQSRWPANTLSASVKVS